LPAYAACAATGTALFPLTSTTPNGRSLEPLAAAAARRRPGAGRRLCTQRRAVVNAILYLDRAGCRAVPARKTSPPWRTVYGLLRRLA